MAREVRERLVAEGHDEAHVRDRRLRARTPRRRTTRRRERVIQAGEPIVLDIGGTLGGYGSDITRTLWVTGGDPANGPGRASSATCSASCTAPRRPATRRSGRASPARRSTRPRARPIEAEGYGEAFFHRTGHGIGLEGHEEPYLVAGNARAAARRAWPSASSPGSTSPGEYGARIEDIVVCGPDGPIVLNEAPRELYVVDG